MMAMVIARNSEGREVKKSQGSAALERLGLEDHELAAEFGVNTRTAARWRTGERLPTPTIRKSIRKKHGIPVKAWREPYEAEPPVKLVKAPPVPAKAKTSRDILEQARAIAEGLSESAANPATAPGLRARLLKDVAQALKHLAELEQRLGLPEAEILEMPTLKRIFDVVFEVLKKYPTAAQELGDKLRAMKES